MKRSSIIVIWSVASVLLFGLAHKSHAQQTHVKGKRIVPVIWDDFSDSKLTQRTGKDPWGRRLPKWTVRKGKVGFSGGSLKFTGNATLETPSKVTVGTWKARFRYPNDRGKSSVNFEFIHQANGSSVHFYPCDGHWWVDYWRIPSPGKRGQRVILAHYIVNMPGSCINERRVAGKDWHDIVMIRDADGRFYTYLDGHFVRWSLDRNTDIKDNVHIALHSQASSANPALVDDIQVYDGVFLPPPGSITYDAKTKTVTAEGFNITLEKIAKAVNKQSVFSYNRTTRTAVCNADLMLKRGSRLSIENQTLKMAGTDKVGRKIKFDTDVSFLLKKATLTTTGAAPFHFKGVGKNIAVFNGILSVVDSTVSNFGGLKMRGIDSLNLVNSKFTNLAGARPMYFIFTVPTHDLTVRGCLFEGKTGTETIVFTGGDQFGELTPKPVGMDFVDCRFRKVTFLREYDPPYYHSPGRPGGTANAVNCKFDKLKFNGTTLRMKYYLDVQVVDARGKGVPGAIVTVVNDQDDQKHPAENLLTGQKYLRTGEQISANGQKYFAGHQSNWFKGWVDVNDHRTATTGKDGHTPLPKDISGTLVVTDRVRRTGNPTYTYTVRATTRDGLKGEVKGVKPTAKWFRKAPNKYANTIKVVVK